MIHFYPQCANENVVSTKVKATNGVRQGGVISSILFSIYIDVLMRRLEASKTG